MAFSFLKNGVSKNGAQFENFSPGSIFDATTALDLLGEIVCKLFWKKSDFYENIMFSNVNYYQIRTSTKMYARVKVNLSMMALNYYFILIIIFKGIKMFSIF